MKVIEYIPEKKNLHTNGNIIEHGLILHVKAWVQTSNNIRLAHMFASTKKSQGSGGAEPLSKPKIIKCTYQWKLLMFFFLLLPLFFAATVFSADVKVNLFNHGHYIHVHYIPVLGIQLSVFNDIQNVASKGRIVAKTGIEIRVDKALRFKLNNGRLFNFILASAFSTALLVFY